MRSRSPSFCLPRVPSPPERRKGWREAAAFAPDWAILFRRLSKDPRVPRRAKAALLLVVPYLLMPFDLIPDFIPVVGQLDDLFVVVLALRYVTRRAGSDVVRELWPGSEPGLRAVLALAS